MVEYMTQLDTIFNSLADPTRRDILARLQWGRLNVTEIARPYDVSLAAISKHLKVLEQARLVIKRKRGRERYVMLSPKALQEAADYLRQYEVLWNERFDRLEKLLEEDI